MISAESAIEKVAMNMTEKIPVQAPIDVTFAASIEQLLSEAGGVTRIKFHHALGLVEEQHRQGVGKGWGHTHAILRKRTEAAVRGEKAAGR